MERRTLYVLVFGSLLVVMMLAACSPQVVTQRVLQVVNQTQVVQGGPIATSASNRGGGPNAYPASNPAAQPTGVPATGSTVSADISYDNSSSSVPASNRMIVKDGTINLLVVDPDVALDRLTQVVGDTGGYIISSRVWYTTTGDKNYKNATVSIGVPVDQFENVLVRLRGIAKQVIDENETGNDVTDQYVDLQSQLTNLQATRDRIRSFLDKATTIDDILKVNDQLSQVEQQIETIQGKQKYLADRSAYSTLTITLTPDVPTLTQTPTATPTATPTPSIWNPGRTFSQAGGTLASAYQSLIDVGIWILVVIVPIVAPIAAVVWLILFLNKRRHPFSKVNPGP